MAKKDFNNPVKIGTKPEVQTKPMKPTHRYFCDSCTGVAFYYVKGGPLSDIVKCKSCGMVNPFKKENLIAL